MNEPLRIIPVILAVCIYGVLIALKIIRIREADRAGQAGKGKYLRFELIRLIADGVILTGFLLGPLYPLWFGLFPETALGYCTGYIFLIVITLYISLIVDWFPARDEYRKKFQGNYPISHYIVRQFVSFFQIYSWLMVIWSVFLLLEPTKTSLPVKIILAAAVVLVSRLMLYLARKSTLKAESEEEHGREKHSN